MLRKRKCKQKVRCELRTHKPDSENKITMREQSTRHKLSCSESTGIVWEIGQMGFDLAAHSLSNIWVSRKKMVWHF